MQNVGVNQAIKHYAYIVTWSPEDGEHVGLCAEFPSLSWLAGTPEAALKGIQKVVAEVVADMQANGEPSTVSQVAENVAVESASGGGLTLKALLLAKEARMALKLPPRGKRGRTMKAKRNIFAELTEGFEALKRERERIHVLLNNDAQRGLADIAGGRTVEAEPALTQLQQRRKAATQPNGAANPTKRAPQKRG